MQLGENTQNEKWVGKREMGNKKIPQIIWILHLLERVVGFAKWGCHLQTHS